MPSLYPGACGFGDMRSRFLYIRDMLVNANGNIDRNSSNSRNQGHVKQSEFLYRSMSVACGRIHQGHEQFRDDPQGRKGPDFLSVWLLIHSCILLNVIVELSV